MLPTFAGGISFGVLAQPVMGSIAPVVMSLIVFSGAAQFAALTVLTAGGGAVAAIAAGMLMNGALAADGARRRPVPEGRAAAARGRSRSRWSTRRSRSPAAATGPTTAAMLIGATLPQGARVGRAAPLIGVLGGALLGDPQALGLDAMFPAFFAVLLAGEARGQLPIDGGGARRA